MEENNIIVPMPPTEGEPETGPTRAETTAVKVADTAGGNLENGGGDGGEGEAAEGGAGGESGDTEAEVTVVRRKRGRPRKYQVEENTVLSLSPDFSATLGKLAQKRGRGRPPGTGKLQIPASLGGLSVDTAGGNLTPHAITINTGEDIVEQLLSFAQRGPRSICVLSAVGPISIVDICPAGYLGVGILRYEGQFELLTLSGSFAFTETGGGVQRKTGKLSVSLANLDGCVFGGAIAGSLIAAGPFQLILGSFKQSMKMQLLKRHSIESSTAIVPSGDLGRVRVSTPIGKYTNVEDTCTVTPPSLFPGPQNVDGNIISDQNVSHASLQSSDQNASQPSDHGSDESHSDIN